MKIVRLIPVILVFIFGCSGAAGAAKWPQVNEFEIVYGIEAGSERIYLNMPVLNKNGHVVYNLICRGGSQDYLDKLGEQLDLTLVPPLNCSLYVGDENEDSLLAEDNSPNWHSRGQIFFYSLVGACRDYPEYGVKRHFSLRGFKLSFYFDNIEVDEQGSIKRFDMKITLRKDQRALTERAAQVKISPPHVVNGECK